MTASQWYLQSAWSLPEAILVNCPPPRPLGDRPSQTPAPASVVRKEDGAHLALAPVISGPSNPTCK